MAANPSRFSFLLLLGLSVIFIGMIMIIIAGVLSGSVSFGGVIIIGPIPIILGSGENAVEIALVASILTVVCLLLFFLRKRPKEKRS